MNDLIILGSGVHAGEMAEIVGRINRVGPTWRLLGYLARESQSDMVGADLNGHRVLGTSKKLADHPGCHLAFEHDFHDPIDTPRSQWASLVDPSAFVSASAIIGGGCVIYPNCFVGLNARLGDRVFMLSGSVVNHDDVLEDNVTVCSNVSLAGSVSVGKGSYLGQACTIRQFIRVGSNSLGGKGSVVVRDVPSNSVVAGNPSRVLPPKEKTT
jgi:sugar O-acyltransferase (sialic acid O-acetyltransferase NeuD family)